MSNNLEHLKEMISLPGLSGYEAPIRTVIEKAWEPLTDKLEVSKLGSLHGLKRGSGKEPRHNVMVATHMDAIGLIVTRIHDGFLYITQIGGIDHRVLPGQEVTVHGTEDLPGIIIQPPAHTLPPEAQSGPVPLQYLLVDTGLTPRQVENKVKIGDLVSFATQPIEFKGNYLAGHTIDNRSSVAALTSCLEQLGKRVHSWDVWAVATSQEEETLGGALTSGFALRPTIGIVIDVTHAKSPGASDYRTCEMNKGPSLDWGPNTHPKLFRELKSLAMELEIPFQDAVYPRYSGTDAMGLQVVAEGIPNVVISIPLRYMHTPVELVQVKDIDRTARLVAEFISSLDENFAEKLEWDQEESGQS